MNHMRIALTVGILIAVLGAVPAQEALADYGYLCGYCDLDVWGIHNSDEDPRRSDYIADYYYKRIVVTVDPDPGLDVEIALFVCYFDLSGESHCRQLTPWVDRGGKGYPERLSSPKIYPGDFTLLENLFGFFVVAVHCVSGCGSYWIDIDVRDPISATNEAGATVATNLLP